MHYNTNISICEINFDTDIMVVSLSGNGRLYDPVIARVLSPDNYVQNPYNPQNYNRYSYCYNNPLVYVDPSGDFIETAVIIGLTLAGAYFGGVGSNQGELNPTEWDWRAGTTYMGIGFGALLGYVGGYSIMDAVYTVTFNFGLITPVVNIYLAGSGSDWSFQWTTPAGGGGEKFFRERRDPTRIKTPTNPGKYDNRFLQGSEYEAMDLLVRLDQMDDIERAMYQTDYGWYYEPYYQNNTRLGGSYKSARRTDVGYTLDYQSVVIIDRLYINAFYHTHHDNTGLAGLDLNLPWPYHWAVGHDRVRRGAWNMLPSVDIYD
jgi:RHS repeat-associated protein